MWPPSLRARLVAAFVGVVAVGTFLAAILTMLVVHHTFDQYLDRRAGEAVRGGVQSAQEVYQQSGGRWTEAGLDRLAHELVLTGYDFKLAGGGRTLLDTTRSTSGERKLVRVTGAPVLERGGRLVANIEVFALQGGGSTPADAEFQAELDRIHLIAATFASLLAIILGLLLARRLTGPLRALASAARSLGGERAGAPLPVAGAPEIKEIGQALAGLSDSLERQQRARRQLAQDLAHELRTPLTLILSRIEAMQDGVVPFEVDGLESVHAEVLRLTRLIGDIEQLAESEAHPRRLETRPIALDELALEAHGAHADTFERVGVALVLDARRAHAMGDPDAVRQILTNLLSNALKYTPEGGRVRLDTGETDGEATLTLSDTGPGIDQQELDKVFDRTYRGASTRSLGGGMGLGLAIAQELARSQGGQLTISPSTRGAAFTLSLPAVDDAERIQLLSSAEADTRARPGGA